MSGDTEASPRFGQERLSPIDKQQELGYIGIKNRIQNNMFSFAIFILLVALYSKPVLSQWANSTHANGQYITYSGLISGVFRHPQAQIDQGCPDYSLGPHNRSYLYIGQFPFDANPFFFELYHFASEPRDPIVTITDDSIYGLDFTSVGYPCMKDGELCGSYYFAPWYYVAAEILDLGIGTGQRRAVVERVQVDGKTGYKVSGDQTSFISNGTINNQAYVALPLHQPYIRGCMVSEGYIWNSSVPFTYNLTFTQTSASISLYIATTRGALTLSFDGTMEYADVELFTTDPNIPKFNNSFPPTTTSHPPPPATSTRRVPSSGVRGSHPIVLLQVCAMGILGVSLLM